MTWILFYGHISKDENIHQANLIWAPLFRVSLNQVSYIIYTVCVCVYQYTKNSLFVRRTLNKKKKKKKSS